MAIKSIKIVKGALDEQDDDIILRGVVDPASLENLKVAEYQREILPTSKIAALVSAIQGHGGVPDIYLGMRGGNYIERDEAFYLQDDVYIIDGLQRRTAALQMIEGGMEPRLGAIILFNTTEPMERERFKALNTSRVKLSPNVLLRNERHGNPGVDMLFSLCKDSSFVLYNRVSWQQRMKREEFITAMGLLKATGRLHQRFAPGVVSTQYDTAANSLNLLLNRIGRTPVRNNIKMFWSVLDECFNIQQTTLRDSAPYLRQAFLNTIARVFAYHEDFWRGHTLTVEVSLKKKLATFPLGDPHVASLCSSGGASQEILYSMIVNHLNSGKRTKRLRAYDDVGDDEQDEE